MHRPKEPPIGVRGPEPGEEMLQFTFLSLDILLTMMTDFCAYLMEPEP